MLSWMARKRERGLRGLAQNEGRRLRHVRLRHCPAPLGRMRHAEHAPNLGVLFHDVSGLPGGAVVDPLTRRPSAALRWCRPSPPSVGLDPPPFVTAPTLPPSPRFAAASCSTCPSRPRAESVACHAWGPLGALHRRGPLCGIHSFSIRKALQGEALAAR